MHKILFNRHFVRHSSKVALNIDKELLSKLETGEIKPRNHPGIHKSIPIAVPIKIQNSLMKCIGDQPIKQLVSDGEKLSKYIASRHPPPEQEFIEYKIKQIENELNEKHPLPDNILTDKEKSDYYYKRKQKLQKMLKNRIYAWKPINYGKYESLVYAIERSAIEYAILLKIFNEIQRENPQFVPRSFFDFGSGVGTGMWAASSLWKNSIFEYYNVDASRDMNDLADLILRNGNENLESTLKNVYFRQFLPAKNDQYDLVISAFTLFELSSLKSRLEVYSNLWNKCANYLVIVEEGSRRGFELVAECRDYLIKQEFNTSEENGHIISPCPHHFTCPRVANEKDRTPCNFVAQYEPLTFIGKPAKILSHNYCYLILKKGIKNEDNTTHWPRIIRPTLVRTKHTICRMCTANGNLREVIFTASKHGKLTYHCARSSKWGDKLPITIEDT